MPDSKHGAGKVQGEPRASHGAERKNMLKEQFFEQRIKRTWHWMEGMPIGQIWGNLRPAMSNDSNEL